MDTSTALTAYRLQLETLLRHNFGAVGVELPELIQSSAASLPDDALDLLTRLVNPHDAVQGAFDYGRAIERLTQLKQSRVAETLAYAGAEGIPVEELPSETLDTMARLLATRDRIVKVVADLTLKFLLACGALLVLWVLLQLL